MVPGRPKRGDVLVARRADRNAYELTIVPNRVLPGGGSLGDCLRRGRRRARQDRVSLWCSPNNAHFVELDRFRPAETAALARPAPAESAPIERLIHDLRHAFDGMRGMRLSRAQVQRLLAIDAPTCDALLGQLTALRFLTRTPDGLYVRSAGAA